MRRKDINNKEHNKYINYRGGYEDDKCCRIKIEYYKSYWGHEDERLGYKFLIGCKVELIEKVRLEKIGDLAMCIHGKKKG